MASLIPNLRQQYNDANGEPLAGGKLFSFQAGTSTPLVTYANQDESTENTNPIILDANGSASIFIGSNAYKFVMKDANDSTLWTVDNVSYLYPGSISAFMLADESVTEPKLADNSVAERAIIPGAVSEDKLADEAVSREKISLVDRWLPGDMKIHHTFNGAAPIENGWMLCDGRQVNEANYDAEHGAGAWDLHIVSSVLLNKYLPNFTNKYAVGKATTAQSGASAITSVGNAAHAMPNHTHPGPSHNHKWLEWNGSPATADQSYDSAGNLQNFAASVYNTKYGIVTNVSGVTTDDMIQADMYTSNAGTGNTGNNSAASIQPESIEVQYYMRIV